MPKDKITITSESGVTVEVENLGKTLRAFSRAGAKAEDMKDLMHSVATTVMQAADPPVVSGRLAASLRASRAKNRAVVRAGGARVPYAGPIHYGWPARNIEPQPFLADALREQRSQVYQDINAGLAAIIKSSGLTLD